MAGDNVVMTPRLLLRPWEPHEATIMRELWTERDPRVPLHPWIDNNGRQAVDDLRQQLEQAGEKRVGVLAVEDRTAGKSSAIAG